MTNPVYKIEVWEPGGGSALHTIEGEAVAIRVKEIITDAVGTFSFSLPTKKNGSTYYYNDVDLYDTVKIWLGYDSISGDPLTVGKIYHISAPLSTASGYIRVFSGKNQGEVLQRRLKTKRWEGTQASTIVTELANDLGLGTGEITADTTSVTMEVEDRKYWDVLRELSDYWYDAANQTSKDFFVDINNNLVWKTRPLRTANVETLTVGDNVFSYVVTRNLSSVYNKIKVFGASQYACPTDKDGATEAVDNSYGTWTTWTGAAVGLNNTYVIRGSNSIEATKSNTSGLGLYFTLKSPYTPQKFRMKNRDYHSVHFHVMIRLSATADLQPLVFEMGTNASNCYRKKLTSPKKEDEWMRYDVPVSPNDDWQEIGSPPTWENITWMHISCQTFSGLPDWTLLVDGLYWNTRRFWAESEDATSQTDYGVRQQVVVDDDLRSNSECESRAEALLSQFKDPATQIEIVVPGNTNLIIGDRLSMTIPAEDISSVNYDVFSVQHDLNEQGFFTTAVMKSSSKQRMKTPTSLNDVIRGITRLAKDASGLGRIVK